VKAASNAGTGERLVGSILGSGLHETGHLILSELNLLAAKGGQRKVSDLELVGGSRHDGWMWREEGMKGWIGRRENRKRRRRD
jgi:hypothetical protein